VLPLLPMFGSLNLFPPACSAGFGSMNHHPLPDCPVFPLFSRAASAQDPCFGSPASRGLARVGSHPVACSSVSPLLWSLRDHLRVRSVCQLECAIRHPCFQWSLVVSRPFVVGVYVGHSYLSIKYHHSAASHSSPSLDFFVITLLTPSVKMGLPNLAFTPYTWTMGLSGLKLQFAVATIATCAFWLFGYDMSVMGGVITEEPFLSVFPQTLDATIQGITITALEIGALLGAVACLDLGDRFGRRGTVWLGMLFMVIDGSLQASAWSLAQLIAGRLLSGFGLGLQVATVPTWQAECAKPKTRGRWVMIEGGLQTTGVACGQWVGYAFFFTKGQIQWRMPVAIQLIPATIVFCMIMVCT